MAKTPNLFLPIPITEWKSHVATRGRGTGNQITQRYVWTLDRYNWAIALERQGSPPIGEKFNSNFKQLLPILNEFYSEIDYLDAARRLIAELARRLDVPPPALDFNLSPRRLGDAIDHAFGVNILRDDDADKIAKLRGGEGDEGEE